MKTKNNHPNIGANIRKLRELRNYTQQYVSNQLELSIVQYGKLEHSENINTKYLFKIADILETTVYKILNFDCEQYFEKSNSDVDSIGKMEYFSLNNKNNEAQQLLISLMKKLIEKMT